MNTLFGYGRKLLYEEFEGSIAQGRLKEYEIPNYIINNLRHSLRPYQVEAIKRFLYYEKEYPQKQFPFHLLYNMATGSGKTLVMAAIILHLYKRGYRHFIFFVNSSNIIQKTIENFTESLSGKYLFKDPISINERVVEINTVDNFDESDNDSINIKFTTIQQLHSDFRVIKENGLSIEDFTDKAVVLIADEAHHLNSDTKGGKQLSTDAFSWEEVVTKIHNQNENNILLEFTATIEEGTINVLKKYYDKIIYKYDLKEFRNDGYSKDISLIRTEFDEKDKIIQALILNIYREDLAARNNIELKPVVLFKAHSTIEESNSNERYFRSIVDNLTHVDIDTVFSKSNVIVLKEARDYFIKNKISSLDLVKRIQLAFIEYNCINANNEAEVDKNQLLLNSLEDSDNPIRAVFAVNKLNEGWDVLNLFDIVRLNQTGRSITKNTTIQEAQLIGRGARYFPFRKNYNQDKYQRKYDNDNSNNELRVLEELYYHTKDDVEYIKMLTKELVSTGIYVEREKFANIELKLKEQFKQSNLYLEGDAAANDRVKREDVKNAIKEKLDYPVNPFTFELSAGLGRKYSIFMDKLELSNVNENISSKDCKIKEIPINVVLFALSKNPFFHFNNLKKYFEGLESINQFITGKEYLADYSIRYKGKQNHIKNLSNHDYLIGLEAFFADMQSYLEKENTEYTCSPFRKKRINSIFRDITLQVDINELKSSFFDNIDVFGNKSWYVYEKFIGTSEENKFLEFFESIYEKLSERFSKIQLIRNERQLAIFNTKGRRFEPDFLLFCISEDSKEPIIYQVFIESKGEHLMLFDDWKNEFLKEIQSQKVELIEFDNNEFKLTAVQFYNRTKEKEFGEELFEVLGYS